MHSIAYIESMIKTMIRLQVDKIERKRKENEISQGALAQASDISVRTYQRILKETRQGGAPNVTTDTINGICGALNLHFIDVLEYIPDRI